MTEEQLAILQPLLDLIIQIDHDAGTEFSQQLASLSEADLDDVIACLPSVDALAYFWQGSWKLLARAALLLSLASGPAKMTYEPTPQELTLLLNPLRTASEPQVRVLILSLLTQSDLAQQSISELAAILTDPSRGAWDPSHFTDPRQHRRGNYRYLITALRPVMPTIQDPTEIAYLEQHRAAYVSRDPLHPTRLRFNITQYYFGDPTCLASEVLSCSVISHLKHKTYQDMCFGFVLHVPKNNVCAAANRDLVAASVQHTARGQHLVSLSRNQRKLRVNDFLSQMAGKARRNLPTPAQILQTASVDGHNEIIIVGSFMGQVRARAIFIKVNRNNRLWLSFVRDDAQWNLSAMIFQCALRNNLPIIPIPDDRGEESAVDFDAWLEQRHARPGRGLGRNALPLVPVDPGQLQAVPTGPDPMQVRVMLAQYLQASPFAEVDTFQRLYRRFALTHHPDKTEDEEKIRKFKEVLRLLELLRNPPKQGGPTKSIKERAAQ